jgi:hypothetical protein
VVQANPHFLEKNKIERKMNFWKEIEVPFSLDHLDHLGSPPVLWEAVLVTVGERSDMFQRSGSLAHRRPLHLRRTRRRR